MKKVLLLLLLATPAAHAEQITLPGTQFLFFSPPPSFKRYVRELHTYPLCRDRVILTTCRRWGS